MLFPIALIAVAAYLLGSIPTGFLLFRFFRHEDIRQAGSGNIGATNVLRSGGKSMGAATFVADMLKGSASVALGALLGGLLLPHWPPRDAESLAALIAVLGHIFPVWLNFRGGKGVATGFGVFLVAAPGPRWPPSRSSPWCWPSAAMSRWPRLWARPAFRSLLTASTGCKAGLTGRTSSSPCRSPLQ